MHSIGINFESLSIINSNLSTNTSNGPSDNANSSHLEHVLAVGGLHGEVVLVQFGWEVVGRSDVVLVTDLMNLRLSRHRRFALKAVSELVGFNPLTCSGCWWDWSTSYSVEMASCLIGRWAFVERNFNLWNLKTLFTLLSWIFWKSLWFCKQYSSDVLSNFRSRLAKNYSGMVHVLDHGEVAGVVLF